MSCCPTCGAPTPDAHGLVFDDDGRTLARNGVVVKLQPAHFEILKFLGKKFGRPANKWDIIDNLYQLKPECDHPEDPDAVLKVQLTRIKKFIRPLGLRIENVFGFGYRLEEAPAA